MRKLLSISAIALCLFTSCDFVNKQVKGDGNVITQNRNVSGFTSIDVGGAFTVEVTQDPGFSVKVEADNNLQPLIETVKEGNTLKIRQANNTNLNPTRDIKVYVSAPLFRHLQASGACHIDGKTELSSADGMEIGLSGACDANLKVKTPSVGADLSGACNITLSGETKDVDIQGSGSIDIKAFDLLAESVKVDLSGASTAEIYASVKINAEASGSSDIRYKGNASVSSNSSGAGSIKKVD